MFLEENKIPFSMLRLSYLEKTRFTGSCNNKRYMFETYFENEKKEITKADGSVDVKEKKVPKKILLHIYPDVKCYEKTDINDIKTFEFPYSKDGIEDGKKFLNELFDK